MSAAMQLLLILGLAMDGFAAAVCMGLSMKEHNGRRTLLAVALVTGFHVLMFTLGHIFGAHCARWLERLCAWLPGLLLAGLGLQMSAGALSGRRREEPLPEGQRGLWALAFSTSLDAMTVGLSFAMMGLGLTGAVWKVAAVMGLLSAVGVSFGRLIGPKLRWKAELAGGLILCLLGLKGLFQL